MDHQDTLSMFHPWSRVQSLNGPQSGMKDYANSSMVHIAYKNELSFAQWAGTHQIRHR
jgi:hypothetical protein